MKKYTFPMAAGRTAVAAFMLAAALSTTPSSAAADEPPPFSPPGSFTAPGHFAHQDGATLYRAVCQGCHMPDARGAQGAGMYPALAANGKLASAAYPTLTVLRGRHGMPAFGDYLSDAQIAEVVNFVRSHFDNHYADALTAADVAKLRTPAGDTP
jgi:mono/diheme cytochrome c family protein